jgi:hypothetical protein
MTERRGGRDNHGAEQAQKVKGRKKRKQTESKKNSIYRPCSNLKQADPSNQAPKKIRKKKLHVDDKVVITSRARNGVIIKQIANRRLIRLVGFSLLRGLGGLSAWPDWSR